MVHEKNGITSLSTTSASTQSQLALTPAAAFPLWVDVQILWHEVTSLHQRSDSKRGLLREPGYGCSPGEPRHPVSTALWGQQLDARISSLLTSIQRGFPSPTSALHGRTAFCKLSHRNQAQHAPLPPCCSWLALRRALAGHTWRPTSRQSSAGWSKERSQTPNCRLVRWVHARETKDRKSLKCTAGIHTPTMFL